MPGVKRIGPTGISLSGGGAHGAWSVGALKYLWEEAHPDFRDVRLVYGTSTGSLIAAMLGAVAVTGDPSYFDELEHIYRNVEDRDVLVPTHSEGPTLPLAALKPLLNAAISDQHLANAVLALLSGNSSIYDVQPLENLIDRFMPNTLWKRMLRAGSRQRKPIEIGFCITSLQTGRSMMVSNRTHQDIQILKRALLASTCEPVLMPGIDVFGSGEQWVDGGVRDINPWQYIMDSPVFRTIRTLVAVSCQSPDAGMGKAEYSNIPDTLMRTLEILVSGVFQDDRDQLELLDHKSKFTKRIVHMMPSKTLVGDGLVFDPQIMRQEIRQGFKDAREHLSQREDLDVT